MNHINWKYGIVSDNTRIGYAKVYFEEDDIVSDWWPIMNRFTKVDKENWPLEVQEHVVCLCDERIEDGVILGAIVSDVDAPDSSAAPGKFRTLFEDGTSIEYDKIAHTLTAIVNGKVIVNATDDIDATTQTNINATAVIQAVITAPIIQLNGNVTIGGTLSAGSLTLAPVTGNAGADGKVHGDIEITGTLTADTDVKTGTISLKTHKHTAPSGGGLTTVPV